MQNKTTLMLPILLNILSFCGTFLVLSIGSMLLMQGILYFVTWNWKQENIHPFIIIAGIVIAILLIPFYYLPH